MPEKVRTCRVADAELVVLNAPAAVEGVEGPSAGELHVVVGAPEDPAVLVGQPAEVLAWLDKVTRAVRAAAGLAPRPALEVLDVRDPDASSEVTIFLDGVAVSPRDYAQYNVDPGAGDVLSSWRAESRDVAADTTRSPAFRDAILSALAANESSEFIEDDLQGAFDHFDGDGCAVYDRGYLVLVNEDEGEGEGEEVPVEDLTEGDLFRDPATDPAGVWLPVGEDVFIADDDLVHVLSPSDDAGA